MIPKIYCVVCVFFFQAEDGIRDADVTGVQTCALPISCCSGQEVIPFGSLVAVHNSSTVQIVGRELDRDFVSRQDANKVLEIGRASCRERVWISGGGGAVKKRGVGV